MVEPTPVPVPTDGPTGELRSAPIPRKGGRPPQKRRLGRNQYTKEAPNSVTNGVSPNADDAPNSPQVNLTSSVGNGQDSSDGAIGGRTGKHKNWRLQKLSWHDIRRPAGAMQSYISQRQVELAGEKSEPPAQASAVVKFDARNQEQSSVTEDNLATFKKLNTLQMMDHLSRDLTHWQQLISESTEK